MKYQINPQTVGILFIVFIVIAGCRPANQLKGLVPGAGKLLYNNEIVEGAHISLIPVDQSGTIRPAVGVTDAQGRFQLTTLQPEDGVFPGEFKVVVSKRIPGKLISHEMIGNIPKSVYAEDIHLLPKRYSDYAKTPLTITVQKKGDKNMIFELQDP